MLRKPKHLQNHTSQLFNNQEVFLKITLEWHNVHTFELGTGYI